MKQELTSGATVEVTPASFATAWKLVSAVLLAFKAQGINIEIGKKINAQKILEDNIKGAISALLDFCSSGFVLDLLFQCAKSAVYTKNGVSQKISPDTFEEEANRADFIETMYIIAKENLALFFPKALMRSLETLGQTINTATKK